MKSRPRTMVRYAAILAAIVLATLSITSAQATLTITASAGPGGQIQPSGKIQVPQGGSQPFTITANTGYDILKVLANGKTQGAVPSYTFVNVQKNGTIKALFKVKSFNLTFSADDGVKLVPSGTKAYKFGTKVVVTVSPPKTASNSTPLLTIDGNPATLVKTGAVFKFTFTVSGAHVLHANLPARFTESVIKAGDGTGTVTSAPVGIKCGAACSAGFDHDTVVVLTAKADAKTTFTGWSGGGCSGTGTCQVTLSANTTITATFSKTATPKKNLTVNKTGTGTGSVSSSPSGIDCGATCTAPFDQASAVTLTAHPDTGSTFGGWSGGGCSGTGTCRVTLNADTTVTATFTLSTTVQHTLTVSKTGTGTGSVSSSPAGIDCGATCSAMFDEGTLVTLTAHPATGSTFGGWSGGGCTGTGTCKVTLNADTTVTATFTSTATGSLKVQVEDDCDSSAVGAILVVHDSGGNVLQKFTVDATGLVDLSSFGSSVTFTVGWPNGGTVTNPPILSFVGVPATLGTGTVHIGGGTCINTDPLLGTITVELAGQTFGTVDPFPGQVWTPASKTFSVYQSDLQNDGKLSFFATNNTGVGTAPYNYGYLLDQTFTNGATYTINLDHTSTTIQLTALDNISSVSMIGPRKNFLARLGQLTVHPPAQSGTVPFAPSFPADSYESITQAPILTDTNGIPYSSTIWFRVQPTAPTSVTVPSLLKVTDFTFDATAAQVSWTLSESSPGKLGSVSFSNVATGPPFDDREWTIVLDPTTHSSWAESNLTLPTELSIAGRTVQSPSMRLDEYSYISTYSNALKAFYGGGVAPPATFQGQFTLRSPAP
jgi:hypothetical protein